MKLIIQLPFQVFQELEIIKFVAEGENGYFCILPKHIDCVSILYAGIVTITKENGLEHYFAIASGVLLKKFNQLFVLTEEAYESGELSELENVVKLTLEKQKQIETEESSGVMKLELEFAKRFYENSTKN